jgi:hypothetical protein
LETVLDHFSPRPSPYWVRLILGHGDIEREDGRVRFVLEDAPAARISDAQIHDYAGPHPQAYRWRPPLHMAVRARFSHPSSDLRGTAGFGFWNDPFTLAGDVTAPPNNAWFFYASPPSAMELVPGVPGHGWKAAVLDGGRLPGPAVRLAQILLGIPFLARLLGRVARARVRAAEVLLPHDMTAWHTYELEWRREGCTFWVDGVQVLATPVSPTPPLGFVAWVDNQYAVATPDGAYSFGRLDVPGKEWLELQDVEIRPLGRDHERR